MSLVVASSDWHVDATTLGMQRAHDVVQRITEIAIATVEMEASLFVFGGDLMDGHKPDERTWTLLDQVIDAISIIHCPILMVAGNHDVVDKRGCRSALAPFAALSNVWVAEEPMVYSWPGVNVNVIALPHVSSAHLPDDHMDTQQWVDDDCRWLLENSGDGPLLVVSHLELDQISFTPGSEEEMPSGQRAPRLPHFLIDHERVRCVVQGHYHSPQTIGKIHIVGSVERLSANEQADERKGYVVIDTEAV